MWGWLEKSCVTKLIGTLKVTGRLIEENAIAVVCSSFQRGSVRWHIVAAWIKKPGRCPEYVGCCLFHWREACTWAPQGWYWAPALIIFVSDLDLVYLDYFQMARWHNTWREMHCEEDSSGSMKFTTGFRSWKTASNWKMHKLKHMHLNMHKCEHGISKIQLVN